MSNHILSLTSIRGVAAALVVVSHLREYGYWYKHSLDGVGAIGVAIFFCLSGFLMGYLYLGRSLNAESGYEYLVSRFSRIAPAYLAVVVIAYVIYQYIDPLFPIGVGNHNLLRHLLFSGNAGPLWSIPPEVQFYGLFFLLWISLVLYKSGAFVMLACMFVVLLVGQYYQYAFPGVIVFSKLAFFLLGVVCGAIRSSVQWPSLAISVARVLQMVFLTWGLLLLFLGGGFSGNTEFWNNTNNAIWAAVLVLSFSFDPGYLGKVLNSKLLVKMGAWSFSLYLTHVFVLYYVSMFLGNSFLEALLAITLCIVTSFLFYTLVEKPGIRAFKYILEKPVFKTFVLNMASRVIR